MTDDRPIGDPGERTGHRRLAWFVEALRAELARTGVSGQPEPPGSPGPDPAPRRRAWAWRAADR